MVRVSFLGGTGTVTGSKYLVEHQGTRVLVDCGLFQGRKELRTRNWDAPGFDPATLDAALLTHAHLDHSGYLPLLVKRGFKGRVYASEATADLCEIMLRDAGYLQEEAARYANKHQFSKHSPALPLYTARDAETSLRHLEPVAFDADVRVSDHVRARFCRAGHILGAASVHLSVGGRRLLFSGDLGRRVDPVMNPPAAAGEADVIVVESTYGDRKHPDADAHDLVQRVVSKTVAGGGVVLIPAFAVGRTQSILRILADLRREGRIPHVPTFLNSPMAINATELFCRHHSEHRLSPAQCTEMCSGVTLVKTAEESKALNQRNGPMVIVSASGMATGGRILHHLVRFAPDPANTVMFTGFQAPQTRGASMVQGATSVKIHGSEVPIRATIVELDSLSAHADADEILTWLSTTTTTPSQVFVTHGEPDAAEALAARIRGEIGWKTIVPAFESIHEV